MASEAGTCNGFFTDHGSAALNNYFQQLSSTSSVASNGSAGSSGASGNSAGDGNNNDNSQTNSSGSSTSSVSSTNSRVHSSNSASSGATSGSQQWNDIQTNQQRQQQQHQQQQQQQQQQQLSHHQHQQQQHHQQSHAAAPLSAGAHHHPHHPHLSAISHSLTQNLPAASNTHSIFGTGNFHYKTNNSWTVPSLSCYQRIYNEAHYQRNFHSADASCNPHSNTVAAAAAAAAVAAAAAAGNESLLSNHHQQPHHQHHHHGNNGGCGSGGGGSGGTTPTTAVGAAAKRFQPAPTSGKSGNSKEICGDDKFKEDGDPWNVEAQTAFLGPNLWDKPLPYDADLKYADLDEFLSENNISDGLPGTHLGHGTGLGHRSDSLGHSANLSLGLGHITTKRERSPSPSDCISPDTLNPPSPAESTFSFASSGRDFDPRTRAFSDEELKPQPMIKKSRKQFVPDELKDDKYWARRRKNNIAAKRSRDARRQKENQIAMRARYLEKENATLHQENEQLKQENMDLRARLSKFQDV